MKLSDLVERLKPLAPHLPASRLTRQVRHWSSLGLVAATADLHEGPGRHRRYDERHLYRAALLLELSKFGMSQRIMQHAVEWLAVREPEYLAKHGSDPFSDAVSGIGIFFIFGLLRGRDGKLHGWLAVGRTETDVVTKPGLTSWITIDMNMVLGNLL